MEDKVGDRTFETIQNQIKGQIYHRLRDFTKD